ncbi:MAG: hypothetical protein IPP29_16890 [Bacteroidetes bacterium]|nr:hypothetical protein [Bacteroidota bacterium]
MPQCAMLQSHPVDVVSGMLFTDEEFALPGIIPFNSSVHGTAIVFEKDLWGMVGITITI